MTRKEFEAKAIRKEERVIKVPAGWWGTWRDVYGPKGQRVRFLRDGGWSCSVKGQTVTKHDSRASAIRKAAR